MRSAGLAGRLPKRYRRTTIGDPFTVLPDLVQRDFTPSHPGPALGRHITYIRTWEGWLYLATVLDCFSRRVVGWAMDDHLRTELPLRALEMALARRTPTDTPIHHTDRGCQYTSEAYTTVLVLEYIEAFLQPRAPPHNARQPQSGRLRIRPHRWVRGLTNVLNRVRPTAGRAPVRCHRGSTGSG